MTLRRAVDALPWASHLNLKRSLVDFDQELVRLQDGHGETSMRFGLSKSRFSPIAIDFGADRLKLLQIVPGDPPQMVAAAAAEVPDDLRSEATARYAWFTESIRKLIKAGGFKGKRAVCSIPAHQTLVQYLQMPRVENEDFDAQVATHLRERLNADPSGMVIRSFPVAQVVRNGSPKQEVICLVARRDVVIGHIECAQRAKLDVIGMHCEPLLILRAFGHLFRRAKDSERTTCFVDIGSLTTKLVIAHGAEMAFAQNIRAGGDQLTRHLAKDAGISLVEAREQRIREANAARSSPASGELDRAERTSGALAMIESQMAAEQADTGATATAEPPKRQETSSKENSSDTLDCLIDELQLCLRYHQSIFPDRPIEKLVFLGGESRNEKICQAIACELKIGAQLGDPFARLVRFSHAKPPVDVDARQPQPGWAVPLGLCLSDANA